MRLSYGDGELANSFFTHPEIYPMISDDYADPNKKDIGEDFLRADPRFTWLVHPNEHSLFLATAKTHILFEIHTLIKPEGRGILAVKDTKRAATWFFQNSSAEKLVTYVPFFNRPAKVFARTVGFANEGICTKSFLKHGVLHDQWVLGLEKEKFLCQQS